MIVESTANNIIVAAGPGSGKTSVIVSRLMRCLEQGNCIKNIILITFTKQASSNMINRLGVPISLRDLIGTFHSVAFKLIIQNADLFPTYSAASNICDEHNRSEVLLKLLTEHPRFANNEWLQHGVERRLKVRKEAINHIKWCTGKINNQYELYLKEYPEIDNIRGFIRKLLVDHVEHKDLSILVITLIDCYFYYLDTYRLSEYDDLIHMANKIIDNPKVIKRYKIRNIFVDELQDIDPIQREFLSRLRKFNADFFMVGDDDQAIYGFKGFGRFSFESLASIFSAKIFTLTENHRSNKDIVGLCNHIISLNQDRVKKKLFSRKEPITIAALPQVHFLIHESISHTEILSEVLAIKPDVKKVTKSSIVAHCYPNPYQVALGIALMCRTIMSRKLHATIAILHRWNHQASIIEQGLSKYHLNYSRDGITYSYMMLYIIHFIELLVGRGNTHFKYVVENFIFTLEEYATLIQDQESHNLYAYAKHIYPEHTHLNRLIHIVDQLTSIAASGNLSSSQVNGIINEIIAFRSKGYSKELETKGLKASEKKILEKIVTNYQAFLGMSYSSIDNSIKSLPELLIYLYSLNEIQVSTIHASKGKEYDYVFVIGNEPMHAFQSDDQNTPDREEERRLLYVALTRARHHIYIAHSNKYLQKHLEECIKNNQLESKDI